MKFLSIFVVFCLFFVSCSDDNSVNYNDSDAVEGDEVGNLMPNFILKDEAGKDFHFKKNRGNVLLLKFWSPTCNPCVSSMPQTIEIHETYYNENFRAVSISNYSNHDTWKNYLEEIEMESLINLFDETSHTNYLESIYKFFEIRGIPYYVILDKYGIIRFKGNAHQSNLLPIIEEYLEE